MDGQWMGYIDTENETDKQSYLLPHSVDIPVDESCNGSDNLN
jgi:hypothetical protein